MGYNVYITRASSFLDTQSFPILESEWLAVAGIDPDLKLSSHGYIEQQGQDGQIEKIYAWNYVAHPDRPPFWFMNGAIETKNPDEQTVAKMVTLAEKLQAKVIGEEGEVYSTSDADLQGSRGRKPWWKRLLGG
jgi:hypothetical protein